MISNFYNKLIIFSIISFFLLFSFQRQLFAESIVVFKYFNKDKYITYINSAEAHYHDNSFHGMIMNQFLQGRFDINKVPNSYYNVLKQEGLSFFGFNFTQYVISPKKNDRFRHILWFDNASKLLKVEVYDNLNMLLFAFGSFDFMKGYVSIPNHDIVISDNKTNENTSSNKNMKKKYKFKNNNEFYSGFHHFRTLILSDTSITLSFNDGVNNMSIYIKKASYDSKLTTTIAYGNYLIRRVIDGLEYTVYGTVPFSLMEDILQIIVSNYKAIYSTAVDGKQLVKAIYSK